MLAPQPYKPTTKDRLLALATSTRSNNYGADFLSARKAKHDGEQATAIAQQKQALANKTTQSAHISKSLRDASTPEARNAILDYYIQNPVDGIEAKDLERFRNAPDAVLESVYNRSLTIQERLKQDGVVFNQDLKTKEFNQKVANEDRDDVRAQQLQDSTIADRDADNQRADILADNTIANTQSQISDRDVDNQRADLTLAETQRSNRADEQQAAANAEARAAAAEVKALAANNSRTKPFADAQAKAATFGHRAETTNAELKALEDAGYNYSALRRGGALASQETRKYERAQREFINAVLRQESGAAIAQSEFDNAAKQYFPTFGDDAETRKRKAQARERAAEGLKRQSQGAYEALYADTGTQTQSAAGEGQQVKRRRYNPQTGRIE